MFLLSVAGFGSAKTINLAAICTPADYNTRPLDTIYSNFIDALPVVRALSRSQPTNSLGRMSVSASRVRALQVKYCSENNKRLIHFSTCEVYGKTIGSFLPKDHPLRKVMTNSAHNVSVLGVCHSVAFVCG